MVPRYNFPLPTISKIKLFHVLNIAYFKGKMSRFFVASQACSSSSQLSRAICTVSYKGTRGGTAYIATTSNVVNGIFGKYAIATKRLHSGRNLIELSEGDLIELTNGNNATITAKLNSGWWSVVEMDKLGATKQVKVRTSDFKLNSQPISSQTFGSHEVLNGQKNQIADRISRIQTVNNSSSSPSSSLHIGQGSGHENDFDNLPINLPTIVAPSLHANTFKWIIFSDIHVKSSSIDTCERVLDLVHEAAVKRNAGILFLGDFWHVRGALSVDLLNRVMKSLKGWTQPVILIPGNHDQVTLGGTVHAVEPLSYAFSKNSALLISEPSLCLGALWLPYRRNYNHLQRILQDPKVTASSHEELQSANATTATKGVKLLPPVSMIFCHADVRGAYMNDGARCDSGLELSDFPGGIPVYSGHFHKPHTMKLGNSRLRYVGSPYQTSLSEAGQAKYLYCMGSAPSASEIVQRSSASSNNDDDIILLNQRRQWYEEDRWEIDIGRKYYKLSSISDSRLHNIKSGDRAIIPVPLGEEASVRKVAEELLAKGVEVELKYDSKPALKMNTVSSNGSDKENNVLSEYDNVSAGGDDLSRKNGNISLDSMDPLNVFEIFMKTNHFKDFLYKTDPEAISIRGQEDSRNEHFFKRVYVEGKDLLNKLDSLETSTHGDIKVGNGDSFHDIQFETVSLSNFGPYGGPSPVVYPLSNRGLVLMRGASTDRSGADSNGSGKTTLAMSVLWALTGSMDTRLVSDGKITEVAFEDSSVNANSITGLKSDCSEGGTNRVIRTAEVKLQGYVNNRPFNVTRRRGKKSELLFEYEHKDCSMQSVKDTQDLINRTFGIDSGKLQRSCFFGQHSHTMQSLLGLSDSRFKSELSLLVNNTSLFVAASNSIKIKDRNEKQSLNNLGVEKNIRNQELSKLISLKVSIDEGILSLSQQIEKEKQNFIDDFNMKNNTSYSYQAPIAFTNVDILLMDLEKIQSKIKEFQSGNIEKLRQELDSVSRNRVSSVKSLDFEINKQNQKIAVGYSSISSSQLSLNNLGNKVKVLEGQLSILESQMQTLLPTLITSHKNFPGKSFDTSVNYEAIRTEYNSFLLKRSSIESQVNAIKAAIEKIKMTLNLERNGSNDVGSSREDRNRIVACHDSTTSDDSCPTCGQELSYDKLQARLSELHSQLSAIEPEFMAIDNAVANSKRILDAASSWMQLQDKRNSVVLNRKDNTFEQSKLTTLVSTAKTDLAKLDSFLFDLQSKKSAAESEYLKSERIIKEKIQHFQSEISKLHKEEYGLRLAIEQSRKMEKMFSSSQGDLKNKVAILEERKNAAFSSLDEKNCAIVDLERTLKKIDEDTVTLHENIAVNGLLSLLFGPRGIQHFIYLDIISLLQKTANGYLNILSQGGLQLGLQSLITDESPQVKASSTRKKVNKIAETSVQAEDQKSSSSSDTKYDTSSYNSVVEDRIVKNVYIRNSSNNYSERSISQLSGGQYRRVSLALDLAFTECLRRKGLLRSNLLVMDESLTHLDARGRESVGQLLRALVRKTSTSPPTFPLGGQKDEAVNAAKLSKSSTDRNSKISLDSESINKIEYLDTSDNSSSTDASGSNKNVKTIELIDEEMATCVPYSTIIVILQDLIATELEEAFDHIDIVKKESDISTVIIDDH